MRATNFARPSKHALPSFEHVVQRTLVGWFLVDDPNLNWPGPVTFRTGDQSCAATSEAEVFEIDGEPAPWAYMCTIPVFPLICFLQSTTPAEEFLGPSVAIAASTLAAQSRVNARARFGLRAASLHPLLRSESSK